MVREPKQAASSVTASVPPLESCDHLTHDEFECRYHALPNLKKAELIS
ncbi:MAG: hypothetical protein ACLFQP_03120 [Halothece sp.]